MIHSVSIEEAQARLPKLIEKLKAGEELVIMRADEPVARLTTAPCPVLKPRRPGSAVGKLRIISEDDEHLDEFREYMP